MNCNFSFHWEKSIISDFVLFKLRHRFKLSENERLWKRSHLLPLGSHPMAMYFGQGWKIVLIPFMKSDGLIVAAWSLGKRVFMEETEFELNIMASLLL